MSLNRPKRSEWSAEENTIAVFFASRDVPHADISDLLERRGYLRRTVAVSQRLRKIRQSCPTLMRTSGDWDRAAVDNWILLHLEREVVFELLGLGELGQEQ
jgi:hypothetical protein